MGVREISAGAVALLTLSACIAVPVRLPEADPYRDEIIEPIQLGTTTMNEVVDVLGQPDKALGNDRWFIYEEDKQSMAWFWVTGSGYYGAAGLYEFGDTVNHYLLINFDIDDVAQYLQILTDEKPCNDDNSVCYSDGVFHMRFDPLSITESFPDQCSVFLYSHDKPVTTWWDFNNQELPMYLPIVDGVIHRTLKRGQHLLEAAGFVQGEEFYWSTEIDCNPQETYFFASQRDTAAGPRVNAVTVSQAQTDLQDRRLVLNPSTFVMHNRFVESLAPYSEIAHIISHRLAFTTLSETDFQGSSRDLYVKPGCRCSCLYNTSQKNKSQYDTGGVYWAPLCIEARAGYTYFISSRRPQYWVEVDTTPELPGTSERQKFISSDLLLRVYELKTTSSSPAAIDPSDIGSDDPVIDLRYNSGLGIIAHSDAPDHGLCAPLPSNCGSFH